MTIKLGLIVLGAMLIYGSWKDLSIRALIFGDNQTTGGHPISGTAATTSTTSTGSLSPGVSPSGQSSPAGVGAGGATAAATSGVATPTAEQLRTGFGRG